MGVGFEGAVDVQKERILHVGDNDAKNAAFAVSERASMEIGMIVEFFGCAEDAGPGGAFDNFEIVQDARDRGRRHAGLPGDNIKIYDQRTPFAHRGDLAFCTGHSTQFGDIEMRSKRPAGPARRRREVNDAETSYRTNDKLSRIGI